MAKKQVTEQPVCLRDRWIAVGWMAEDIAEATGLMIGTVERFIATGKSNHDTQAALDRFVRQRAMFA